MVGKQVRVLRERPESKGQGVVEYAGSLVIAAIIVAAGLIIVPPSFASLMDTIYSSMGDFLTSFLQ